MIEVYTDASIRHIPHRSGGIGIYFPKDLLRSLAQNMTYTGMTIQSLEAEAVYLALQLTAHNEEVSIFTDCRFVVSCLITDRERLQQNKWRTRKGRQIKHFQTLKKCLKIIDERRMKGNLVTIEYVEAHASNPGNNAADKLAARAALQSSKTNLPNYITTRTTRKRRK